jgi:glucose/arabinose dehydrogenase
MKQAYRYFILLSVIFLAGTAYHLSPVSAQPSVTWPSISLAPFVSNLSTPLDLVNADDGSGRMFVAQMGGTIRIIKNGVVQAGNFLDIHARVSQNGGEQGLLSLAFPPNYARRGYFFVYYTRPDGNNQISRFYVTPNPDVADPNSEETFLVINHPNFNNHNGGTLLFGPDGYLYLSTGDGGSGGDPNGNGQNKNTLLGKLLRLDVQLGGDPPATVSHPVYLPLIAGKELHNPPYLIPASNPYAGQAGKRGEVWAIGLRNPWRTSFDRLTGDLFIGDVGQNTNEEIDFQPASSSGGENYGWNIWEGPDCYPPGTSCAPPANYQAPVAYYPHGASDVNGCAVVGGYMYHGSSYPTLQNIYFYSDNCSGKIWGLQKDNTTWVTTMLLDTPYSVSSFGEDQAGELYVVSLSGEIFKLTGN